MVLCPSDLIAILTHPDLRPDHLSSFKVIEVGGSGLQKSTVKLVEVGLMKTIFGRLLRRLSLIVIFFFRNRSTPELK